MNEVRIPENDGVFVREDERGVQRSGCHERHACRYANYTGGGIAATLDASYYKGPGARNGKEREFLAVESEKPTRKYIVRRLTPTECARLQGFPDWWAEGLGGSDSAIYKAYGNGLALPCAYDVMNRIARFVEHEKEDQQ